MARKNEKPKGVGRREFIAGASTFVTGAASTLRDRNFRSFSAGLSTGPGRVFGAQDGLVCPERSPIRQKPTVGRVRPGTMRFETRLRVRPPPP